MKAEQLRKSILQYAIQGKLVPQIDTEEPARVLLKKIKAEKQELIKQGKIKKENPLPPITDEEKPFEIPDSWEWVRLSQLAAINGGFAFKSTSFSSLKENNIRVIRISDFDEDGFIDKKVIYTKFDIKIEPYQIVQNDIIIAMTGGTVGKSLFVKKISESCYANQRVATIKMNKCLNMTYINCIIQSDIVQGIIKKNKNSTNDNISMDDIKNFIIPFPPLAEQQRIVARVEELMAFVDEYDKKEIELSKLEKEFPEKLKKSILQYAIQGKLVPQIDIEEPANELLKKIKAEKQELIKQGKFKKQKDLPSITDEEKPFEIPDSWEWVFVDDIVQKTIKRGKSPKYIDKSNTLVFAQKCNTKINGIDMHLAQYLDETILNKYPQEEFICNSDIIINSTGNGTMGRVGIFNNFDNPENFRIVPDSHVTTIRVLSEIYPIYAYYYLKNNQSYFESMGDGSTNQTELKPIKIASLYFPLPPFAEQQRIVARIEELFALVDMLAGGKKLKTKEGKTALKVIENVIELKPHLEVKKPVDVSSFGLAAREDGEVTQCDLDAALSEVQDFYDKKKD